MTKKALKRIVKKKQPTKKKGVRKHLAQNLTQQDGLSALSSFGAKQVQQGVSQPIGNIQNLRQTLTPSAKGNNLRSSLLTSMGMPSLFGMSAQQYGNINNEKNIRDAQMRGQTLTEQINTDKRTIDEITAKNKQLEEETKALKKQLKDKKHDRDKLQNQNEIAHDNLDESKRVELEINKLTNRNQHLQVQLTETQRQNEIIKYKQEKETLETNLHNEIMENQRLNKEYERNHYYQEMQKVKDQVQMMKMQNSALEETINSQDFTNPNEELQAKYKELYREQARNDLLLKQQKAINEVNEAKLIAQSQPTAEDLASAVKQVAEDIKQKEMEKLRIQYDMYKDQKIVDEYNYNLEKRRKLDQEILELNNEHATLQESASKMDTENKGELGKNIKKKLEIAARAQVENEANKRRIQRALNTQQIKEEAYKDQKVAEALESDPIDEAKIKELAELQSTNEFTKEKIQTLTEHRKAKAEYSKAQAQAAWFDSSEYKTLVEETVQKQNEINAFVKAKEQMDVLNELKKKAAESNFIMQYTTNFAGEQDTSLAAHVTYLTKELDNTANNVQANAAAFAKFKQLQNENPELSKLFAEENPAVVNGINTYGISLSLDKLNEYIAAFEEFIRQHGQLRTT